MSADWIYRIWAERNVIGIKATDDKFVSLVTMVTRQIVFQYLEQDSDDYSSNTCKNMELLLVRKLFLFYLKTIKNKQTNKNEKIALLCLNLNARLIMV